MKKELFAALALALACSTAGAGQTTGQVTQVFTFEYPNTPSLLFVLIGNGPGPASCGSTTSGQNRWVTRTDTPAGKSHMLAILMAQQTGRPVTISGKGTPGSGWPNGCDVWIDTESIHAVFLGE
jgi:hypothetical protein